MQILTPQQRTRLRRFVDWCFAVAFVLWITAMLVNLYGSAAHGYEPPLRYQLQERIPIDEQSYVIRFMGVFDNLPDCVAKQANRANFECVANMPGEDTL